MSLIGLLYNFAAGQTGGFELELNISDKRDENYNNPEVEVSLNPTRFEDSIDK